MPDPFFIPLEQTVTSSGIEARCRIPPESPWFSGHFPSNPIFPALGMMGLVDRVLEREGIPQDPAGVSGREYRRVRFRQIVRPGEEISFAILPLEPGAGDRFRFKIFKASESIAEGVVVTQGPPPDMSAEDPGLCRVVAQADAPIEALVPHRDRMRLVDIFEGHDEARNGISRSVVKETWPLCDGKAVNPHVMIELVAQATSAMAGWDKFKLGEKVGFGYIVGIKNACICASPLQVGALLTMKTRKVLTQGNYGVFSGTVNQDGRTRGEVLLQVFQPEE
jgi:predicted hotdog family 3-hydroxylacyl-ACP dehydratase